MYPVFRIFRKTKNIKKMLFFLEDHIIYLFSHSDFYKWSRKYLEIWNDMLGRTASVSPCPCVNRWVISCPYRPGHSPWVHWMLWNVESVWKVVKPSFHDVSVSWAALNSALFTPQEGKRQHCSPGLDEEHNDRGLNRQQTQDKKSHSSRDVVDSVHWCLMHYFSIWRCCCAGITHLSLKIKSQNETAFCTHCGVFVNRKFNNVKKM